MMGSDRPRELHWYHAGPMLFGDWGTSRLYVLGLAFMFTGRASFWYVAAMCVLLIAVGWCYTVVCRLFPDGGGVYSSAKKRSQLLAVVGGLLLCADYIVTASLSCLDAFHYIGIKNQFIYGMPVDALLAAGAILAIGGLNVFGPTKTGTGAMLIAIMTVVLTLIIAVYCIPHLGDMRVESPLNQSVGRIWIGFTEIVLALSGVEAIANMTGIMVQPVEQTARRSIMPVLCEIVVLNLILAAAMCTLPDEVLLATDDTGALLHTGDMLKVIAATYVGPAFAAISSLVFAALLLSAVNTSISALVSVLFMLSRDRELPARFASLNRYGMPKVPLYVAMCVPAVVVLIFPNVEALAGLYAIGVVGAIGINLGSISTNRELVLKRWERGLMFAVTALLVCIEITIAIVKPDARGFAMTVLAAGLAGRLATMISHPAVSESVLNRKRQLQMLGGVVIVVLYAEIFMHNSFGGFCVSTLLIGGLCIDSLRYKSYRELIIEYKPAFDHETREKPKMLIPGKFKPKARLMVATQGNSRLLKFAFDECKNRQAELAVLFIRHLAVTPMGPTEAPKLEEDQDAIKLFSEVREMAQNEGVPLRLLFAVARDIPETILDMAVTHAADILLLGATRRGALWKAMKGDVMQGVAEQLPESVGLLIHA